MKYIKSFPRSLLLIPMLISSIIATLFPNIFMVSGLAEALLSGKSIKFLVGTAVFISGTLLNISVVKKIIKRYGILILSRIALISFSGLIFLKCFLI